MWIYLCNVFLQQSEMSRDLTVNQCVFTKCDILPQYSCMGTKMVSNWIFATDIFVLHVMNADDCYWIKQWKQCVYRNMRLIFAPFYYTFCFCRWASYGQDKAEVLSTGPCKFNASIDKASRYWCHFVCTLYSQQPIVACKILPLIIRKIIQFDYNYLFI